MKTRLERLIEKVTELRDQANDDELMDELDNALLHLDAASDRLIAIDEEEDDSEELDPVAVALADELIAACSSYEDLEQCSPDHDADPL